MSPANLVCDIHEYYFKKEGSWGDAQGAHQSLATLSSLFPCSWIVVYKQTCSFFSSYTKCFFFLLKWQLPLLLNTTYASLNVPRGQSSKHRAFHICFSSFLTVRLPCFNKQPTPKEQLFGTISLSLGGVKISHEQEFYIFLCKLSSQDFKFVDKPRGKKRRKSLKAEV